MNSDMKTHLDNLETLIADLEQVIDVLIVASDLLSILPREFKRGQSLVDVATSSLQNILAEEQDEITMTRVGGGKALLGLGIIEKHVLSFRENYPDTKEPKQPVEPQKPKKPEFGSSDLEIRRYERAMKGYPKRHKGWEKRVEKWLKDTHPRWQVQEDRLKRLRQIQVKENGTLYAGSAHRAIRITGLENELETEYYLSGDGEGFPNFENIFNRTEKAQHITTITDVTNFKKFVETVAKAVKVAKVEIDGTTMMFKGTYGQINEVVFESASWKLDRPVEESIRFGINPKYLADMLKLFKQLKIKEIEMYVTSPILPIVFIAGEITYIITPIRIN